MSGNKRADASPCLLALTMALILLFRAIPVIAQLPTGTILGLVKDASGASIPKATVTVLNVGTDLRRTFLTSEEGAYRFPALPVGRYTVKAESTGFKTETHEGLGADGPQEEGV